MRRRDFLRFVAGAAAWPAVARAQGARKVYHILWLSTGSEPDPFLDGFREGLRALGYVEGRNFTLVKYYGNQAALRPVISELRRGDVDLAVSSGPATRAMTTVKDIPVLFALSGDPVALGVVKSLAQPGTNFTGSTFLSLELAGKRVELLKDIYPRLRRLAVLSNTDHPGEPSEWHATLQTCTGLGIKPSYIPFAGAGELNNALEEASGEDVDAMLVFPDVVTMVDRAKLAEFALAHRLPSMFGWSEYCEAGGLLSYGANQRATYRWLASYADRILRGEDPAALPVMRPEKFELVINLKTARLLGIELDTSAILFRANKVIA
ncbi:ABC transporter substrate-binding protein [Bradyrhizobium sp. CB82]|uniref:ABC transporter substrate-binding protein n=1 Tax=Bradyrhizobium sp. CB82 TaxID=3039159 RepID=UPI0024B13219|nr:ABC transporter substrate-binding protein [Bradyrhizobium sp. CB82]WFU43246.1 ABC transporter substrate-binding protein [Bradyrhizobium sp. CB82]